MYTPSPYTIIKKDKILFTDTIPGIAS